MQKTWTALVAAGTGLLLAAAASVVAARTPTASVSTTRMDRALRGEIYLLPPDTRRLPQFERLKPVGAIWVRRLDMPDQAGEAGFPGVAARTAWFGVDFKGRFEVAVPGDYLFRLTSDDGSRLLIDGRVVIDNDGAHLATAADGAVQLAAGDHAVEVQYFQGSGERMALTLDCRSPQDTALRAFPDCGLALKSPGVSLAWLWWVAILAAAGAAALWLAWRRLASESPKPKTDGEG